MLFALLDYNMQLLTHLFVELTMSSSLYTIQYGMQFLSVSFANSMKPDKADFYLVVFFCKQFSGIHLHL